MNFNSKKKLPVVALCMLIGNTPQVFSTPTSVTGDAGVEVTMPQQKGIVTGIITDVNGEPVIGANVVVKGTTNGTITDIDGKFSVSAGAKDILTVSYIGYLPIEVSVAGKNSLNIQLAEDTQKIDEVIVTAYGTSKKSSFTGSATVVGAEQLARVSPTNISQGLQGLSAGVQVINASGRPGEDATIVIRGLGSMTADTQPLYVIDGVPSDAPLNSYSPSDIESITVMKDAASTSLYGSRAGNGVVMITTKKGKQGKAKVNARASWGTSEFAVKFPKKVSAGKQWELAWEGLYNDATDFMEYSDEQARQYATEKVPSVFWNKTPLTLSDGTKRDYRSGWNMDYPIGLDGKLKSDARRLWEFDAFDNAFEHRLKQDYGVDISGAMGESNNYYASFSMLDDKGVHISDHFRRFTGRAVLDTKVKEWLQMSNSIMYTNSADKNGGFGTRVFRVLPSEYSAYLWDYETNNYSISPYTGKPQIDEGITNGRAWWPRWSTFGTLTEAKNSQNDNVQTVSALTFKIMEGLSLRSTYSFQLTDNNYSMWKSPERENQLIPGEGYAQRDASRTYSHTVNNVLTYDKTFNDIHHINVLVGQEAYSYAYKGSGTTRYGLDLPYFTEVSLASKDPKSWSSTDTYALASFFAKADYDFNNRYYISGSIRTDGSSRFHPDNRWGQFWSVGGSWRISQESFMEPTQDWLQNLKLKASYGQVGNDRINGADGNTSWYAYQGLFTTSDSNYGGNLGVTQSQLENREVKWETNIQTNVGIEFTVFNKLSGSVEYFSRKSKDLLMLAPLAPSVGMDAILKNIGDIENKGWEVELNYTPFHTKDFDWNIVLNATGYKNKITSLPSKEEQFNSGVAIFKWKEGGSRYDIYTPEFAGVNSKNGRNQWWKYSFDDNGNVTGREATENYSEVDTDKQRRNQGSMLPDVYGGLTNNFRYKNVDLSFMLYYSFGGKVYDYNYSESSVLRENFAAYDVLDDRWQKPGDVTDVAKIYTYQCFNKFSNAKYSDQYLFNNNYVRLKNVTLGYNLPKSLLSKCGIDGLRVYFRGDNLLTFGKLAKHGTDPENGTIDGVVDGDSAIPALRSYNVGINFSF